MIAVALALPLEHFACGHLGGCTLDPDNKILLAWAVIEEVLKYGVVAAALLWRGDVDEPIDYVVYMITAALGFAALENALFLIGPFSAGHFAQGFLTENLRFVGSTLLHVVASAAIGFAIGFTSKKSVAVRVPAAALGLILAVGLHTLFNVLIISQDGSTTLPAFFTVWTGIIVFFALFEALKSYEYRHLSR
jgi:RsiW-degrading membrane proteinase PrsW (M82 family)